MKKTLSLLLALMMLALPVMGLADDDFVSEALEDGRAVNAVLTFRAGNITGDATMDGVVQDVLNALKLNVSFQGGENPQGGLVVSLSDKDIITLSAAQAQDAVYLLCNMLGEKAVMVKPEDVEPLIKRFIDTFELLGALSSYEASELKAQLTEAFAQGMNAGASAAVQMDEIPEPDMSALIAFVEGKVKEEAVTMQPRNSDPAAKKVVVTLTGEDLVQIVKLSLDAVRGNAQLMEVLNANVSVEEGMTIEELFAQAESEMAALPEMIKEPVVLEMYLDDEDEPVYATAAIVVSEEGSGSVSTGSVSTGKIGASGSSQNGGENAAEASVAVDMNYARLTMNDVETHAANMIMKAEGETVSLSLNVIDDEDKDEIRLDMGDGVNQIGVYVTHAENEEGDTETAATDVNFVLNDSEMSMNLTLKVNEKVQESGKDANAHYDIALLLDQTELFGLTVDAATADPEASIATENAIRLAELSDEDFMTWLMDTVNGLQLWAVTAVQALPASVLMLMMGQ